MADTVNIPEWLQYAAGALGILITTIVGRMGWRAVAEGSNQQPVEVAGAIVDNRAAREITQTLTRVAEDYLDMQEKHIEMMRIQNDEIRRLHQEIRELAREIAVHSSRN